MIEVEKTLDMNTEQYIAYIKSSVETLYQTNPNIHIRINQRNKKTIAEEKSVKLVGVYKNIFQVEESVGKLPTRHSFQYGDILIGHITIRELNCPPLSHTPNKIK